MPLKAVVRYFKNGKEIGWTGVAPEFADYEVEKIESLGFNTTVELIEMEDDDDIEEE